jgi:hypothetical protein
MMDGKDIVETVAYLNVLLLLLLLLRGSTVLEEPWPPHIFSSILLCPGPDYPIG